MTGLRYLPNYICAPKPSPLSYAPPTEARVLEKPLYLTDLFFYRPYGYAAGFASLLVNCSGQAYVLPRSYKAGVANIVID